MGGRCHTKDVAARRDDRSCCGRDGETDRRKKSGQTRGREVVQLTDKTKNGRSAVDYMRRQDGGL